MSKETWPDDFPTANKEHNTEEDWYPFESQEKETNSDGLNTLLGGCGLLSWGAFGCLFIPMGAFFCAAGTAGIMESSQDRRAIDLGSAESLWLIFGWAVMLLLIYLAVSAGIYLVAKQMRTR